MQVSAHPPIHLTYCLNVHKGESWTENFQAIEEHALKIRSVVGQGGRFGLGLRLSRQAAAQLHTPAAMDAFRQYLRDRECYVFTINGFPYGQFHDARVKADVYAPDWSTRQRLDYTCLLGDILGGLLPAGVAGSISTSPLSYAAWARGEAHWHAMVVNLAEAALHMWKLAQRTTKRVTIALEPEPDCCLQTTDDVIAFFGGPLERTGAQHLRQRHGLGRPECEEVLGHLGVCVDTAHMAVQFEEPAWSLKKLQRSGVLVAKVQLSAALEARSPEGVERLSQFDDGVYLHQVHVQLPSEQVLAYPDLGEALADPRARESGATWRVHFHVPLFFEGDGGLSSTSELLRGDFAHMLRLGASDHLEIETYTLGVLPLPLRPPSIVDAIAREYAWVRRHVLQGA
jgi:hypothetical protein